MEAVATTFSGQSDGRLPSPIQLLLVALCPRPGASETLDSGKSSGNQGGLWRKTQLNPPNNLPASSLPVPESATPAPSYQHNENYVPGSPFLDRRY